MATRCMHRKVTPEAAIRAWNATVLICPRVPKRDAVLPKEVYVRRTREKPEVLHHDALPRHPLCGQQREPITEVNVIMEPKRAERVYACPVLLACAPAQDITDDLKILLHR